MNETIQDLAQKFIDYHTGTAPEGEQEAYREEATQAMDTAIAKGGDDLYYMMKYSLRCFGLCD